MQKVCVSQRKKTWFSRDSAAHHISKNQNKCQQGKKKQFNYKNTIYIYMFEFRILICAHVKGIIDFDTRLRCCTHSHLSRIFICASALYNYICGEIATTQNSQFISICGGEKIDISINLIMMGASRRTQPMNSA